MVADRVAFPDRPLNDLGVPSCRLPNHEEGRTGVVCAQKVQKTWSGVRVGSVVEGERDCAIARRHADDGA
jgi:hypothetical protein